MRAMAMPLLLLAFAIPSSAVGQATAAENADPLVGCYRLEIGEWTPRLDAPRYQIPPAEFRMLAEIGGESPFELNKNLVRPVIPYGRTPSAIWQRSSSGKGPSSPIDEAIAGGDIQVTWTNGFAGVRLRLLASADSLHGTAIAFTDMLSSRPLPQAQVVARRVPCPNEHP
jgi:hypothetical protein